MATKINQQKSGFGIVGIIIIIAALAVLGGSFLYLRELQRLKNITAPLSPVPAETGNSRSGMDEVDILKISDDSSMRPEFQFVTISDITN